ncbi:hypothetical protein PROFUN_15177 [Planoprotostelium fungivorum]|uniref:Uncharacterized protein n=1 Tax=Planoprotostelium fungivorum TaxID=1890364 RepID=A0A2P6MVY1_9EUKA|nr:hypothetical protein PROFUN_15177 [Planoprotostelium fungivorum]
MSYTDDFGRRFVPAQATRTGVPVGELLNQENKSLDRLEKGRSCVTFLKNIQSIRGTCEQSLGTAHDKRSFSPSESDF